MSSLNDPRPQNWDWVKATHECSVEVMFGRLQEMATQNVAGSLCVASTRAPLPTRWG